MLTITKLSIYTAMTDIPWEGNFTMFMVVHYFISHVIFIGYKFVMYPIQRRKDYHMIKFS